MAKRILIADDSLTIQKAFAMTFAGEDVTLLAARSADEGLTLARQARPELVIADGLMPGRSGYDLCTAIKGDPGLRGVPVYILTSSQNPYDEARGRESGADGQLTKPFETTALMERVNEAIAKGASAAPLLAIVQAGPAPIPSQIPSQIPSDDDYGEITVEPSGPSETTGPQEITGPHEFARPVVVSAPAPAIATRAADSEVTPPPRVPVVVPARPAQAPVQPVAPVMAPAAAPGGLRPSLIPGLRPGAVPAARPGSSPVRPVGLPGTTPHVPAAAPAAPLGTVYARPGSPAPAARGPAPPVSPLSAGPARTLMGLPAALAQPPARSPAPISPARPVTQPVQPQPVQQPVQIDTRTPHPFGPAKTPAPSLVNPALAAAVQTVQSKVDQKMAEISARGPEYDAIAKLSREIIERIVWEVVPELTEVIVREELQKRGRL